MSNSLGSQNVPDSVTQKALSANFSVDEKARRESMITNKNFYYDKQEGELELVNSDVNPATINFTKPVIRRRSSMLYRSKLVREFEGSPQSISFLEKVYAENKIDRLMQIADLNAELTGSCLIHPTQTDRLPSGIKLKLFDSSQFSAVSNEEEPQEADAISFTKEITRLSRRSTPTNPQVEKTLVTQIWTDQAVVTYDSTNQTSHQLLASQSNDLGFLPFVNVRGEPVHNQYLGHAPATLVRKLNAVINQKLTNLLHACKMQGFSPIALTGFQSGEAVTIHPGSAISLPVGATASVLSTSPKILEMLEVLRELEEKLFETSSVPRVSIVGGEAESGRALLVRFFPLLQVFEDKSVHYEDTELELANTILRVVGLDPLDSISVQYDASGILPFGEEEDTLERDIQLSIKTPIDELMRRNPSLTEEDATAEYLANRAFNSQENKE